MRDEAHGNESKPIQGRVVAQGKIPTPIQGRVVAQGKIGTETVLTVAITNLALIDYSAPHEPIVIILD